MPETLLHRLASGRSKDRYLFRDRPHSNDVYRQFSLTQQFIYEVLGGCPVIEVGPNEEWATHPAVYSKGVFDVSMSVRKDAGIAQQSIGFPYIYVDHFAFAVSESGLEAFGTLFGMAVANCAKPINLSTIRIDDLEIHPYFAPFREARG